MSPKKPKAAKGKPDLVAIGDSLWRNIVKKRDPICRICGEELTEEAHHIQGRSNFSTRHDLNNGLGCGAGCHRFLHDHPILAMIRIRRIIGDEIYDRLEADARKIIKKNDNFLREKINLLKKYKREMEC
jgi:hypothetical protein